MKAITLHQPWASLVAQGIKTIETKSWSTHYRGRLAIHASKRIPDVEILEDGPAGELFDDTQPDNPVVAQWWKTERADYQPESIPAAEDRWSIWTPRCDITPMPLGRIIATCELVDVVPIVGRWEWRPEEADRCRVSEEPNDGDLRHQRGGLWLTGFRCWPATSASRSRWYGGSPERIEDQRPYGDFRPGRYAWLLADIKATTERCPACWGSGSYPYPTRMVCQVCNAKLSCEPVPARGRQRLWEWSP